MLRHERPPGPEKCSKDAHPDIRRRRDQGKRDHRGQLFSIVLPHTRNYLLHQHGKLGAALGDNRPMAMRLPASQRTREELTALIEGRLSTASAKDELIKLVSRLIVE
ncbi:MAG: hypothetical protein WB820_06915, partial [Rhodoplanes sp.]